MSPFPASGKADRVQKRMLEELRRHEFDRLVVVVRYMPAELYARRTDGVEAMNDPIVEEVRRIRDAHAARFHYDLDAIFQDIKEQENRSGHTFISGASCPAEPNKTPQPTGPAPAMT